MENNNNESYNPAQPFSTESIPAQPTSSISPSHGTIILLIILIIVIISGGVVLYIVNQAPNQINEPPYTIPPTETPLTNTLQSDIIPTITPTIEEELQSLDTPLDTTADLQDIDSDLQQL